MRRDEHLGLAWRKHSFVYCCVITEACLDVTVLAWRKYTTVFPTALFLFNNTVRYWKWNNGFALLFSHHCSMNTPFTGTPDLLEVA
jgi:hypothetical protein